MYYVETTDFTTFSPARLLYDGGFSAIDAFVTFPPGTRHGTAFSVLR